MLIGISNIIYHKSFFPLTNNQSTYSLIEPSGIKSINSGKTTPFHLAGLPVPCNLNHICG